MGMGGGCRFVLPLMLLLLPPCPINSSSDVVLPNAVTKVLLQPQLRPSPLMSKRENLDAAFMPFSSPKSNMEGNVNVTTPLRKRDGCEMEPPLSAFSSFSPFPFCSPNYSDAVIMQHMGAITPAIIESKDLTAPASWEAHDLKETLSFGETPNRRLDIFLVDKSGTGPKLPSTEEMSKRTKSKINFPDLDIKPSSSASAVPMTVSQEEGKDDISGIAQVISTSLSFSEVDVVSPQDETSTKPSNPVVTDSGPLRMRIKSISRDADLSTHHFDAWQSRGVPQSEIKSEQ